MRQDRRDPVPYLVAVGVVGSLAMLYPPLIVIGGTFAGGALIMALFVKLTRPAESAPTSDVARSGGEALGALVGVLMFFFVGAIASFGTQIFAFLVIAALVGMVSEPNRDTALFALVAACQLCMVVGMLVVVVRAYYREPHARLSWISGGFGWCGVVLLWAALMATAS